MDVIDAIDRRDRWGIGEMAGSTYIFCMYLLFVSLCKRLETSMGLNFMGLIFFDSGSFIQRDGWLERSYALYFVLIRWFADHFTGDVPCDFPELC